MPEEAAAKASTQNGKDDSSLEKASDATIKNKPGFFSHGRLLGAIDKDHGDLALLACCLATGMVDAASFSNWGVFVGMQTGNTVILGLSTAGNASNPHAWLTTLISILSFLLGAFLTFRTSQHLVPLGTNSNRLWAGTLFFVQSLLVLLSAILATPSGLIPQNNPGESSGQHQTVLDDIFIVSLIPPLAFQSGMQIATSRLLGFNELPVNVLTSTYCDIMGDYRLFALNNVKRDRRVGAVVLVLVGAVASGWLMRSKGGLESVLYFAAGIKFLCATAVWVVMPGAKVEEAQGKQKESKARPG